MYVHAPCRGLLIQADAREGVPGVVLRCLRAELTRVEGGSIDGGRRAVGLVDDDLRSRRDGVLRIIHIDTEGPQLHGILLRVGTGTVPEAFRQVPVFLAEEGGGCIGAHALVACSVAYLHLGGDLHQRHFREHNLGVVRLARTWVAGRHQQERRVGRYGACDRLEMDGAGVVRLVQHIDGCIAEDLRDGCHVRVEGQHEHIPDVAIHGTVGELHVFAFDSCQTVDLIRQVLRVVQCHHPLGIDGRKGGCGHDDGE